MEKKKIKVLIVDDQALVLDILKKGLSKYPSIEVVGVATNGFLAFNEVNRTDPDVIVLDMEMPTMNGIQFLQRLMPINPKPTIVLSALTDKDSKVTQDAFEAGAVDFLPKPKGGARELPRLFAQLATKIKIAVGTDVSHYKKERVSYKDRKKAEPKAELKEEEIKDLPKTALDRQAKTNNIILGMGAMDASDDPSKVLKIYALGSCVGVALFCETNKAVGLCHVVLPSSSADREKANEKPGYYADTAVKALVEKMNDLGCSTSSITAKIAGGAKTKAEISDYFGVGQRNAVAVKAALLKYDIPVKGQDVGKEFSRTVWTRPGDSKLYIQHPEKGTWTL